LASDLRAETASFRSQSAVAPPFKGRLSVIARRLCGAGSRSRVINRMKQQSTPVDADLLTLALAEVMRDLADPVLAPRAREAAALDALRALGSADLCGTDLVLRLQEHLEDLAHSP
jgi:hypothetical protein